MRRCTRAHAAHAPLTSLLRMTVCHAAAYAARVAEILSELESQCEAAQQALAEGRVTPDVAKQLRYADEMCTQQLLVLDGVSGPGVVRVERRAAVQRALELGKRLERLQRTRVGDAAAK